MRSIVGGRPIAGVRLGSVRAPVYANKQRDDLLLVSFDAGTNGAAVTTTNQFCAAPVHVLRAHLQATPEVRFWLLNAGNANAGTGAPGMEACRATVQALADLLQMTPSSIWPFSTGVIGESLPVNAIQAALPRAIDALDSGVDAWERAAAAIMTTDTHPKLRHVTCEIDGVDVTITGMAKGSGMIHPNMATMFGLLMTDAVIAPDILQTFLQRAVSHSFNCVTVDGDTSTNDACVIAATGQAAHPPITDIHSEAAEKFQSALSILCDDLAEMLARDGEGATKFVQVRVEGARSDAEAHTIANTVALSPLVKTALAASDPNWGRIVAAVGRADVQAIEIDRVQVWLNGVQIVENGARHPAYTEAQGQTAMAPTDIEIVINMGVGSGSCRVMTCDLTKDYVRINAEYRT
jgi:glutamate N-acetyltransferase / amino-acid N-acetyltransferase